MVACPDRPGIVATVSRFLFEAGANIVHSDQHTTDPEGGRKVERPIQVADVHATLLAALGIDPTKELISPAGRPLKLAEGQPIAELLG